MKAFARHFLVVEACIVITLLAGYGVLQVCPELFERQAVAGGWEGEWGSGGTVSLPNGWTIEADADNLYFKSGGTTKAYLTSGGDLSVTGSLGVGGAPSTLFEGVVTIYQDSDWSYPDDLFASDPGDSCSWLSASDGALSNYQYNGAYGSFTSGSINAFGNVYASSSVHANSGGFKGGTVGAPTAASFPLGAQTASGYGLGIGVTAPTTSAIDFEQATVTAPTAGTTRLISNNVTMTFYDGGGRLSIGCHDLNANGNAQVAEYFKCTDTSAGYPIRIGNEDNTGIYWNGGNPILRDAGASGLEWSSSSTRSHLALTCSLGINTASGYGLGIGCTAPTTNALYLYDCGTLAAPPAGTLALQEYDGLLNFRAPGPAYASIKANHTRMAGYASQAGNTAADFPYGIAATGFDWDAGNVKFIDLSGASNSPNGDDSLFYGTASYWWSGAGRLNAGNFTGTSVDVSSTVECDILEADTYKDEAGTATWASVGTGGYTTFAHPITLPDEVPPTPGSGEVMLGWNDTERDLEVTDDGGTPGDVFSY